MLLHLTKTSQTSASVQVQFSPTQDVSDRICNLYVENMYIKETPTVTGIDSTNNKFVVQYATFGAISTVDSNVFRFYYSVPQVTTTGGNLNVYYKPNGGTETLYTLVIDDQQTYSLTQLVTVLNNLVAATALNGKLTFNKYLSTTYRIGFAVNDSGATCRIPNSNTTAYSLGFREASPTATTGPGQYTGGTAIYVETSYSPIVPLGTYYATEMVTTLQTLIDDQIGSGNLTVGVTSEPLKYKFTPATGNGFRTSRDDVLSPMTYALGFTSYSPSIVYGPTATTAPNYMRVAITYSIVMDSSTTMPSMNTITSQMQTKFTSAATSAGYTTNLRPNVIFGNNKFYLLGGNYSGYDYFVLKSTSTFAYLLGYQTSQFETQTYGTLKANLYPLINYYKLSLNLTQPGSENFVNNTLNQLIYAKMPNPNGVRKVRGAPIKVWVPAGDTFWTFTLEGLTTGWTSFDLDLLMTLEPVSGGDG